MTLLRLQNARKRVVKDVKTTPPKASNTGMAEGRKLISKRS